MLIYFEPIFRCLNFIDNSKLRHALTSFQNVITRILLLLLFFYIPNFNDFNSLHFNFKLFIYLLNISNHDNLIKNRSTCRSVMVSRYLATITDEGYLKVNVIKKGSRRLSNCLFAILTAKTTTSMIIKLQHL